MYRVFQEECAILRENVPFVNLLARNSGLLNFSVMLENSAKFGLHAGKMHLSTHNVSVSTARSKYTHNINCVSCTHHVQ